MSSGSNPAKPKLACEIASDRVLAGRLADHGDTVEVCAAQELAPGIVVADLVENNLRQRSTVRFGWSSSISIPCPPTERKLRALCVSA